MIPQLDCIHPGDALTVLRSWPDAFVQTVVTSPPYWGLRDYGVDGQLGLEKTPEEYVEKMVEVFREVRRVMRDDGTLWMNMGDSYASGGGSGQRAGRRHTAEIASKSKRIPRGGGRWGGGNVQGPGLKPKDLVGMPWVLALALRADGWFLRRDIIWSKPNPMPESVTDRPTTAHEYIFLLAKSDRYFYDGDAIREPLKPKTFTTFGTKHKPQGNDDLGGVKSDNWGRTVSQRKPKMKKPDSWNTQKGAHGSFHPNGREKGTTREYDPDLIAGANKRSVWVCATQAFPEAHFATFPEKLIEPCIIAGARAGDIVFDPFMGAGTTAMVAARLNRRFLGIELNPKYIEMAERRIAPELAQGKIL